ncbi:MAG: flagellar basal body P-ring protein FlgI [Planctomycetes bacterium]|nr:flagellar basal body P-ring protein FlgI [Planctomycetota bacterium]
MAVALLALLVPGSLQAQPAGGRRNEPALNQGQKAAAAAAAEGRNPYFGTTSRIKDLARLEGADENQLKGLGLVVGLKGTGDSKEAIQKALAAAVMKLDDYQIREQDITSKNVAMVAVSAEIPPFQEAGTRIDVKVASLYDAKDLAGGTLLLTPLRGPVVLRPTDPSTKTVYATAQGSVYIGGGGASPTAVIPRGAIVQKTLPQTRYFRGLAQDPPCIRLSLDAPDFNVAKAIAGAITKDELVITGRSADEKAMLQAYPEDAGTVYVEFPRFPPPAAPAPGGIAHLDRLSDMIATILEMPVEIGLGTEPEAMVVLNERAKTVAVSGRVVVAPGAVYKGANFKIEVPPAPAARPNAALGPAGKLPPPPSGGMLLTDIIDLADLGGAKPEEVIDMVRAFDRAGLIFGRVVVE